MASSLCLLALAAAPAVALGQSAGDQQYSDPFSGESQSQPTPKSPQGNGDQTAAPAGSPTQSTPPTQPQSTAAGTSNSSGSRSLPYTGYPTALVALLGVFALATWLLLMAATRPQAASRRGTPPVLGRELRLAPRARHR